MCARFTVLNETPIAAAITGCVIPLSRSNTIWMRSRCDAGSFHRSAVFNFRIWLLVHLTICSPESDDHSESYCLLNRWQPATINPPIQSAVEVVLDLCSLQRRVMRFCCGDSTGSRSRARADAVAHQPLAAVIGELVGM